MGGDVIHLTCRQNYLKTNWSYLTLERESMKKQPAVFFARDGVLNTDRGYICRPKELEWTQGAIEAIRELND
jgi:hypothetical protein